MLFVLRTDRLRCDTDVIPMWYKNIGVCGMSVSLNTDRYYTSSWRACCASHSRRRMIRFCEFRRNGRYYTWSLTKLQRRLKPPLVSLSISLNPIKTYRYYNDMFAYEPKSQTHEYYNDMIAYELNSKGFHERWEILQIIVKWPIGLVSNLTQAQLKAPRHSQHQAHT